MKTILFALCSFLFFSSYAQYGINTPWTWMGGDKAINQTGVYGTQTVPNILNKPGSRNNSITWTDAAGNFWLFGGNNFNNDLWKYNTATNEWAWMKGSSATNQFGIYGTVSISAATNTPGSRSHAVGWIDGTGNFWLFGGYGYGESAFGFLSDLWKYNSITNEWTWMKGYKTVDNISVLGTKGVSAPGNLPGGRYGTIGWKDASGNFWLFGGFGYNTIGSGSEFDQLWRYNPVTNEWTWMKGSTIQNPNGVYGTQSVPNALNNPGGRSASFRWIDNSDNLWLQGGYGHAASGSSMVSLNDLWEYNISTNEWTWMKGDLTGNQASVYGTQGIANSSNKPGGRDGGAAWKDATGNFWMFGGYDSNGDVFNDLWKYNISTNNWTWTKGDVIGNSNGIYGTQGVAAVTNKPGGRYGVMSWMDNAYNFWLFGGRGYGETGGRGNLNDLWKISSVALLPVTLVNFTGSVINNEHLLSWQTNGEVNTAGFVIERSIESSNFISIGTVDTTGNSSVTKTYSFRDKQPQQGANFYRLKMLNMDGSFVYSKIIELSQPSGEVGLIISPNPVKDILRFQLKGVKGNAVIQIIDMEGKKIREGNERINEANYFSINIADISPGTYLLSITAANKLFQQKFIVY